MVEQYSGGDPFTTHRRPERPACGRFVRDALKPSMGARRPPSMAPDGPETILPQRATQRRSSSKGGVQNHPFYMVLGGEWIKASIPCPVQSGILPRHLSESRVYASKWQKA